eukprot:jgi/Chlat1/5402/Chrsp35S05227
MAAVTAAAVSCGCAAAAGFSGRAGHSVAEPPFVRLVCKRRVQVKACLEYGSSRNDRSGVMSRGVATWERGFGGGGSQRSATLEMDLDGLVSGHGTCRQLLHQEELMLANTLGITTDEDVASGADKETQECWMRKLAAAAAAAAASAAVAMTQDVEYRR